MGGAVKGCGEAKNGFRNQARNASLKALGTDLVLRFPADNAAGKWGCYTIMVYDTQKPSSCSEGQLFLVPDGKFLPGPRVTKRLHDIFPPFHSTVHGLPLTRPFTRAEGVTLKFRVMKSAPGQWERWTVQAP